jgi:hypothetical protein
MPKANARSQRVDMIDELLAKRSGQVRNPKR